MKVNEILRRLAAVSGTPGHEREVGNLIRDMITPYVDECRFDTLGNLIAMRRGTCNDAKKLVLTAHMDEIGFIVNYIEDNGYIRFAPVGGINLVDAAYSRAVFENGTVGVITPERETKPEDYKAQRFYLDIGARDRRDASRRVKIGDMFSLCPSVTKLGRNMLCGRPFDDRAGCAVMIAAAEAIKNSPDDLYFVFTTCEEVGCRGSKTAAFAIAPHAAIAFDVTPAGDQIGSSLLPVRLGDGAAVKMKDASVICDTRMSAALCRLAEDGKIKYQREILTAGGTDTSSFQMSGAGSAVAAISIPCRNVHTKNEIVDIRDLEACVSLAVCAAEAGSEELLK